MAQYTIGGRVFEWTMPGILRRIEIASIGVGVRAWSAALVSGLHPAHLEREGLAGLDLGELAEQWPDHMAEVTGDRWSTTEFLEACTDAFKQVSQRFAKEMGAEAVAEAEGNSPGDEGEPSALEHTPTTAGVAGAA